MQIKGQIEEIIYRNEENGYSVVVLDVEGAPLTATGILPVVTEGEWLVCEGEYNYNAKYGKQFAVKSISVAAPDTPTAIVRYLASGIIKNVGEVTANAIVSRFGQKALEVIEFAPHELVKIKGISARKADEIHQSFMQNVVTRNTIMFLQSYNIGVALSMRIYNVYGSNTVAVVKSNPYRLITDIDGIGFLTADRIARELGILAEDEFRLKAAVMHTLKEAADKAGHTYLPLNELIKTVNILTGIERSEEETIPALKDLALSGQLRHLSGHEDRPVMLTKYASIEKTIAAKLLQLIESCDTEKIAIDTEISEFERLNGLEFHPMQRHAINDAITAGVAVVTGGPGTGKTTILKCILSIMTRKGHEVRLIAPTGRAAKRMSEATGYEAKTIHRALEADGGTGRFNRNAQNPIEATFVVVDEMSMVDAPLMSSLLKAIRRGTRLLLVGDKDQLPSVGAGNVLADIIQSGKISVSGLTQIFRQAERSRIITNAHLINKGEMPVLDDRSTDSDFFFSERTSPQDIYTATLDMCCNRLPKYCKIEAKKIQILAALKNGAAGVYALNKGIQETINPYEPSKEELRRGNDIFRIGDKVMQTANDYELEWLRRTGAAVENGAGVFNGDIGEISGVYPDSGEITVEFEDGRIANYNSENLDELMLAYAVTIHKSQGCEFDAVIIPIVAGSGLILNRNLLYTAVTRAKKLVVLIGTQNNIYRMVSNDYTQKRYSLLKNLLQAGADNELAVGIALPDQSEQVL